MGNPIDDALGGSSNPIDAALTLAAPPLAALKKTKPLVAPLAKALDYQRAASQEAIFHGGSSDENRARLRHAIGMEKPYAETPGFLGNLRRGVDDLMLDTLTDPLSYETLGVGAARRVGAGALGGVARAARETPLGHVLEDTFTWGGPLARAHGNIARETARGADNLRSATAARVTGHIDRRFTEATKGLSDAEVAEVGRALNGERDAATLPDALRSAYRQLRTLTKVDHKLRSAAAQSLHGPTQQLPTFEHYLPGTHEAAGVAKDRPARAFDALDPFDPRALPREEFEVTDAAMVRAGFKGMAQNTGRHVGAQHARKALGDLIHHPEVRDVFQGTAPATGANRTAGQKVAGFVRGAVGYPRAALVAITPRHAVNETDLLANTAPELLPEAAALAKQLAQAKGVGRVGIGKFGIGPKADPKKYDALTREGRELGALSGEFMERKPFFTEFPDTPGWAKPLEPLGRAAATTVRNTLGRWSQRNTDLVFAVDEANKQVLAKHIAKTLPPGTPKVAAGGLASKRLVDYAHVSKATEAARYAMPFATFRMGIPGAVLGGVARNPMRAAALSRASQGTFYGGDTETPLGRLSLFNPSADIGRGNPGGYLRGSLGAPWQAGATLAGEATFGREPGASLTDFKGPQKRGSYAEQVARRTSRYFTYGHAVDLKWLVNAAAAGIPEARDVLQDLGYGDFPKRSIGANAAQNVLGVGLK